MTMNRIIMSLLLGLFTFSVNSVCAQDTLTLCSPCPNDSSWQEFSDTIVWDAEGNPCAIIFNYEKRICDFDFCTEVRVKDFQVLGDCAATIQDPLEVVASALVNTLYDHPFKLVPELELNGYGCLRLIQPKCWKTQGINCDDDTHLVPTVTHVRVLPCDPDDCCSNYLQAWLDECGDVIYVDRSMRALNGPLGDEAEAKYDDDSCEECDPTSPIVNRPADNCQDGCKRNFVRFMLENWRLWELE